MSSKQTPLVGPGIQRTPPPRGQGGPPLSPPLVLGGDRRVGPPQGQPAPVPANPSRPGAGANQGGPGVPASNLPMVGGPNLSPVTRRPAPSRVVRRAALPLRLPRR
ncbi:MAG TPA: hypothetical protein VIO37_12760 [Candidatus Dormibacteraeota bacterium]